MNTAARLKQLPAAGWSKLVRTIKKVSNIPKQCLLPIRIGIGVSLLTFLLLAGLWAMAGPLGISPLEEFFRRICYVQLLILILCPGIACSLVGILYLPSAILTIMPEAKTQDVSECCDGTDGDSIRVLYDGKTIDMETTTMPLQIKLYFFRRGCYDVIVCVAGRRYHVPVDLFEEAVPSRKVPNK